MGLCLVLAAVSSDTEPPGDDALDEVLEVDAQLSHWRVTTDVFVRLAP